MPENRTLIRAGLAVILFGLGVLAVDSSIDSINSSRNLTDNPSLSPDLQSPATQTTTAELQGIPLTGQYLVDPETGARLYIVMFGNTTCIQLGEYESGNGQSVYDATKNLGPNPYVSYDIPRTEIYDSDLAWDNPDASHMGTYHTTGTGGISGANVAIGVYVCNQLIVPVTSVTP